MVAISEALHKVSYTVIMSLEFWLPEPPNLFPPTPPPPKVFGFTDLINFLVVGRTLHK